MLQYEWTFRTDIIWIFVLYRSHAKNTIPNVGGGVWWEVTGSQTQPLIAWCCSWDREWVLMRCGCLKRVCHFPTLSLAPAPAIWHGFSSSAFHHEWTHHEGSPEAEQMVVPCLYSLQHQEPNKLLFFLNYPVSDIPLRQHKNGLTQGHYYY